MAIVKTKATNPALLESKEILPIASNTRRSLLVAACVFSSLFLLRLPTVLWAYELNVDESQMLSQAMKFLLDPVPWRSVDGTSSGPLNSLLISFFLRLGFHPSYVLAHMLATVLVSVHILTVYLVVLRLSTHRAACWGIAPMVFCLGFGSNPDFLHYSSELLPVVLLGIGFYCLTVWSKGEEANGERRNNISLFLAGLCLGLAPWCKLQATPVSAALGIAVLLAVLGGTRGARKFGKLLLFSAGTILPSILLLVPVVRGGAFQDFWNSYLLGNLGYAGELSAGKIFGNLATVVLPLEVLPLAAYCGFAVASFLYLRFHKTENNFGRENRFILIALALYLASAMFAVVRPSRFFTHYIVLMLFPASCLSTVVISSGLASLENRLQTVLARISKVAVTLAALLFGLPLALEAYMNTKTQRPPDPNEKIAGAILKLKALKHAKCIAIWGWTPEVYVRTEMPPATRDAIGHFVISKGPLQAYFRHRFVRDLRQSMPDVFVDSVAPGAFLWEWTEWDGFESDPELKSFIEENYVLTDELVLVRGSKPVRIYVRYPPPTRF